jgi:hypothetical protein
MSCSKKLLKSKSIPFPVQALVYHRKSDAVYI